MALTALTAIPEIYATEVALDDTIANGVVATITFRTKYPDPPAEVRVVVGPLSGADMQDPDVGTVAVLAGRNAAFAALPFELDAAGVALA